MRYREDVIHEVFDLNGQARYLNNCVLHYPFRDIDHYVAKQDRYSDLMARRMAEQGRQFSSQQLITHPLGAFLMYVLQAGFLDGMQGLILSGLYAY
jgi:(heptosyl)LPS beta-1,4-glucosyltransferase